MIKGGSSGFAVVLGGIRTTMGEFTDFGRLGYYWMDSEHNDNYAYYYAFSSAVRGLNRDFINKQVGFSCRCVKEIRYR